MKNKIKLGDEQYHLQQSEIMIAREDVREGAFAFITEGSLALRELGHYGVSKPISNGESAITALVSGKASKKIYGATSGIRSHLFYYDPSPAAEHVVDIGILGENSRCRNLMFDEERTLYGIINPSGKVFRYNPKGEYSLLWTYRANKIEFLDKPIGETASAVLAGETNTIFGITQNNSFLFSYDVKKRSLRKLVKIENAGKGHAIAIDAKGVIWGSGQNGFLFQYNTAKDKFVKLDIQIPSPKGMEYLNYIDSLIYDGETTLFGGTTLGTVFKLNTDTYELTSYGRPSSDHRIRALCLNKDGCLYGCAGGPEKTSHLFRLNPANGGVRDLGIPMVHFPRNWICYDISALTTGNNGEVYIGESERISNLFIYYPPVKHPAEKSRHYENN